MVKELVEATLAQVVSREEQAALGDQIGDSEISYAPSVEVSTRFVFVS